MYRAKRRPTNPRVDVRDADIFGLEGEPLALARLLRSNNWQVKIDTTQVRYVIEMASDSDIEIHPMPDISLQTLKKIGVAQADSIVTMLSDEENYTVWKSGSLDVFREKEGGPRFPHGSCHAAYYHRRPERVSHLIGAQP